MTSTPNGSYWDEFEEHLELIPEVESYSLSKDADIAKVSLKDSANDTVLGRELFTRVAHFGFIVAEIHGPTNEIKFINILGKHRHYLPDEVKSTPDS